MTTLPIIPQRILMVLMLAWQEHCYKHSVLSIKWHAHRAHAALNG